MGGEFHDTGLIVACSLAVVLTLAVAYRIAVHRARRRLYGRSTRDRERNLPAILRVDRWLGQARRGRGRGRHRRRRSPSRSSRGG